jgi:FkbM family methyltransferase
MSSIDRLIRRAGGARAVTTVFDVGAHDGADSVHVAERHPDIRFVAIEPTPDLVLALRRNTSHLSNYTVVEAAVATQEGQQTFNMYADVPYLNSLNRMDPSAAAMFGRESSNPDSREVVATRRLSSICDELGISTVDVIHIDTQGSDLDVLRSLDQRRLRSIRAGALEVSYRLRLYDTSADGSEVRSALEEMGFRVFRIERLHYGWDWEQNYYFARSTHEQARPRVADARFKSHLAACELRSMYGRVGLRPAERLRVAIGIRTRLRTLANARKHG